MTTDLPYGPQPPAPPTYADPYASHRAGSRLIVPYPELYGQAAAGPPAVWPIIVWTLLFGVLGAISAKGRADQARRIGQPSGRYWGAFAGGLAASLLVSLVTIGVLVALATPVFLAERESAVAHAVESNLVHDGRLDATSGLVATRATCDPVGVRDAAGNQEYRCLVELSGGQAASLEVLADERGNWQLLTTA
jgi:hypothetical protein